MFVLDEAACHEIGRSAALRAWIGAGDSPDLLSLMFDLTTSVRQFLEYRNWLAGDIGTLSPSTAVQAAVDAGEQMLATLEAEATVDNGGKMHVILESGLTAEIKVSDDVDRKGPSWTGWQRASRRFRDELKARAGDDGHELIGLADAEASTGGKDVVVCLAENGAYFFGVVTRGPAADVPTMTDWATEK